MTRARPGGWNWFWAALVLVSLFVFYVIAQAPTTTPTTGGSNWWVGPWVDCQEALRAQLKAPSTATFETIPDVRYKAGDSEALIFSHVDSQNSFGATLRTQFVCKLQKRGGVWTVASVGVVSP